MSILGQELTKITLSRRLIRGTFSAIIVGVVATGLTLAPALFIQAVFIGEAQRCEAQMAFERAAEDKVLTTCAEELLDPPLWFPTLIVALSGSLGVAGGFIYGVTRKHSQNRRR